jgi:N-hydroxyarylamine O-acetyltransferase
MHVDDYLERIGMDRPLEPNLESLRALHRAHLLSISYENLDVQLGRPVTIEIPAIYEKIIENGRGGWCYEMNGIFGWALKELGFNVTRATGSVMRVFGGDASNGNHLVLRVDLDEGLYLADVGFGDGPIDPIRIVPGAFRAHGFDFGLTSIDENWWRMRNHPAGGAPSFDFNLAPADESIFAAKCHWLQTAPDSVFVQNAVCQRFTPDGLDIMRGRTLRHITPEGISERILRSAAEYQAAVEDTFGLRVPEADSLWPKICARHEALFGKEETA